VTILIPNRVYKVKPMVSHWWGWRLGGWTYHARKMPWGICFSRGGYADRPIHLRRRRR